MAMQGRFAGVLSIDPFQAGRDSLFLVVQGCNGRHEKDSMMGTLQLYMQSYVPFYFPTKTSSSRMSKVVRLFWSEILPYAYVDQILYLNCVPLLRNVIEWQGGRKMAHKVALAGYSILSLPFKRIISYYTIHHHLPTVGFWKNISSASEDGGFTINIIPYMGYVLLYDTVMTRIRRKVYAPIQDIVVKVCGEGKEGTMMELVLDIGWVIHLTLSHYLATLALFPLQVVKNQLLAMNWKGKDVKVSYIAFLEVIRRIYQQDGLGGFTRGIYIHLYAIFPHMLRISLLSYTCIQLVSNFHDLFTNYKDEEEE